MNANRHTRKRVMDWLRRNAGWLSALAHFALVIATLLLVWVEWQGGSA